MAKIMFARQKCSKKLSLKLKVLVNEKAADVLRACLFFSVYYAWRRIRKKCQKPKNNAKPWWLGGRAVV